MKKNENATLPSGYTRVEYLESTGTQYIMTDYLVDTDINAIEIDMVDAEVSGDNMIFGVSDSGVGVWMETYSSNNHYAAIGISDYMHVFRAAIDGQVRFDMLTGIITTGNSSGTITRGPKKYTEPLCIFARNRYGTSPGIQYPHKGLKIRSFVIYENDRIVRNYVPCLDAEGKPCLYETVKHVSHYNAGTDEFLRGEVWADRR